MTWWASCPWAMRARRPVCLSAGTSDVVTLHVPELPSTQWMIGAAEIGR